MPQLHKKSADRASTNQNAICRHTARKKNRHARTSTRKADGCRPHGKHFARFPLSCPPPLLYAAARNRCRCGLSPTTPPFAAPQARQIASFATCKRRTYPLNRANKILCLHTDALHPATPDSERTAKAQCRDVSCALRLTMQTRSLGTSVLPTSARVKERHNGQKGTYAHKERSTRRHT